VKIENYRSFIYPIFFISSHPTFENGAWPRNYYSSIHLISPSTYHLILGTTGLLATANATHPPIKHSPPSGVTGPKILNRCGSSTSRYMLPENMVIPAVKRPIASVFCGASTEVKVRTAEWMSCGVVCYVSV
jgi:hypothetical protein